jgi:DUF4097 and DUF4098 domain-containing protein YvlB
MTIRFGTVRPGLLIATALLFSQGAWAECHFSAPRTAEIDANGARRVVVKGRAGDLIVRGSTATTRIQAKGQACARSQQQLDAIRIDVEREGDTIRVAAVLPDNDSFLNHQSLDLTIELPATIAVDLEDSSGDLTVEGVASAHIDDSSGDQSIRDIAGNVVVADSSGDIDIKNIRGNVEVSDSSGDVLVTDVGGNVRIPVDSSGELVFQRIHGDVQIDTDSSGNIAISNVNKNVTIENDSSGSIRVADVGGSFTVEHDSSGGIDHRNVLGAVNIPRRDRDDD